MISKNDFISYFKTGIKNDNECGIGIEGMQDFNELDTTKRKALNGKKNYYHRNQT